MKAPIRILCFIFFSFLLFILFTKQASAITFDQIKEATTVSFTQVLEKIELAFTFKEESRIKVLGKHAERRVNRAEESFDNGDNEKAQNYLDEYVQIKEEISVKLDQVDEKIVDDFKDRTIVENKKIEEFKNDLSETSRVVVEKTQTEVLEKTWEVVGEIQGEKAAENFVKIIYAPGTESGGENKVIEDTVEIKTDGQKSGNTPNTSLEDESLTP